MFPEDLNIENKAKFQRLSPKDWSRDNCFFFQFDFKYYLNFSLIELNRDCQSKPRNQGRVDHSKL